MHKTVILFVTAVCFLAGCNKEAGDGGDAIIKGNVQAKIYDSNYTKIVYQGNAVRTRVYIIYGNNPGVGDDVKTSSEGNYEFDELQMGHYKIYMYTVDTAGLYVNKMNKAAPKQYILKEVDITEADQVITLDFGIIPVPKP